MSIPVPPQAALELIGGGDHSGIANYIMWMLVETGGLRPNANVLDIGCGVGRVAIPLTQYLDASASYEGFDIVPDMVDWCTEHITSQYPNFRFQHADIYHAFYNPTGRSAASTYRFPYPDAIFDFVFLISVFAHLFPTDVDAYLGEIQRVLRHGGRCLASFFLLNAAALAHVGAAGSESPFPYVHDGFRTAGVNQPEWAVAHDEGRIRHFYTRHGLRIIEPVTYTAWYRHGRSLPSQDIVVAEKVDMSKNTR